MANWLERAQREIQKSHGLGTANTAERPRPRLSPVALAELPPEGAAYPWWRVSIVGPKALNIDLEMRAAWSVSDWGRFARRHYGPHATVVARVRPEPDPAMPAETEELKDFFEEKTGILECAGLPKPEAEAEAARLVATLARNRSYSWASLRSALSRYPALLAQVPDRACTVDSLPFGTATVHVREGAKPGPVSGSIVITEAEIKAARKGRTVVRQGDFTGAPEVKP